MWHQFNRADPTTNSEQMMTMLETSSRMLHEKTLSWESCPNSLQFMKKVKLQFMVVPDQLKTKAYVPNAVKIKVIDPEAIFLTGLLGESGRRLVKAGVEFYFEKSLANKLIKKKIAIEVE